jgi:hypothetical protein
MTQTIARLFLRAKHWQLFLLFVIISTVAEMPAAVSTPTAVWSWRDLNGAAIFVFAGTLLDIVCCLAWLGSFGSFSNSMVEPELKLSTPFFHFSLVYPAVYLPIFLALLDMRPAPVAVILPLHLLAMFCIFYVLRFASKALAMAETGRAVSFYDYAGAFFLLWFYPVGIWVVQPRVNRLYARHRKSVAA